VLHLGWEAPLGLAFSPDGTVLAAGTGDGLLKLWRVSSGRLKVARKAHASWTSAVAFSPDGALIASASHDKTAKIWRADTGECLRKLIGAERARACDRVRAGG
jgi:WD40 repeat protein